MRIQTTTCAAVAAALTLAAANLAGQEGDKTTEVLAAAHKALGDKKLDAMKALSVEATLQRNVGERQMSSDVELLFELPDKYVRSDAPSGGGFVIGGTTGFNGDKPVQQSNPAQGMHGGGMIIRMAGPGGVAMNPGEKPTPEQQEQINRAMVRSARVELSRLMLGWFAMAHPSINAQYTYSGKAESTDGKAHVIDVKGAEGFAARLFVDEVTNLPLMVTYNAPQPRMMTIGGPGGGRMGAPAGRQLSDEERQKVREDAEKQLQEMQKQPPTMVEYTLFVDDWRSVDGVKFPYSIRRASAGATTEEWVVSRVKVNPKIDPKKFESQ
jgi:hypothetical protein